MCIRKETCSVRTRDGEEERNEKGDTVHIVGLKYLEINLSVASLVAEYTEGPRV